MRHQRNRRARRQAARPGTEEAVELDRLLAVMSLSRVSVGPPGGQRHCLAQGSFWIFDDSRVEDESVSAGLDITRPREISVHAKAFALLQESAVRGGAARALIHRALTDLQTGGTT